MAAVIASLSHGAAVQSEFSLAPGKDALRIGWVFGKVAPIRFTVETENAGPKPYVINMSFQSANLRDYIDYSTESYQHRLNKNFKGPERTRVDNSKIKVNYSWRGKSGRAFTYDQLPPFHEGRELYTRKHVLEHMDEWMKTWGNVTGRSYAWEFRYDADRGDTTLWLDGQYAGRLEGSGRVKRVTVRHDPEAKLAGESVDAPARPFGVGIDLMPLWPSRANALLAKDAELKLDVKLPFRVFKPSESLDLGCHMATTTHRDLGWDPLMCRHAFGSGPEYMMYSVPNAKYREAYVLCAEIAATNRVPILGTHLTRYGNHGASSIANDKEEVSAAAAATNANIRKVGTLTYRDAAGKRVTTPLWLVRHRLDYGKIAALIDDKPTFGEHADKRMNRQNWAVSDYLDFEFVGAGTSGRHGRSSLQVFGCAIVPADYSFELIQTVRGNIFAEGEKPVAYVEITADADGARGSFDYDIYAWDFAPVEHKKLAFAFEKKGEKKRFEIPLAEKKLGWYGLDYTFYDSKGEVLAVHNASFALLGSDTREAGFESPYACWPHGGGLHGNNPNRHEVVAMMRKAGYRTGWYDDFPVSNEWEVADYPITMSMWHIGNPDRRSDAETVKRRLDKRVAEFREIRSRFPHVQMLQLLHEQGGRDLAPEMRFKPAVRGEYKGIDGKWEVYWCTEAAKRFRKEFPDVPIMIGNGSSSSEKIAELCRNGFDLNLVDYLGIESKGFQTMPELNSNREAPGMLWALKATAKRFGFDLPASACNEYVFRPERKVKPTTGSWGREGQWCDYMAVTDYTIRDYLISLAHGCKCISTGHLEDSVGSYYNTNWGAGGQCKAYPLSYPKRMFVALATFTKVFDKAKLSRRLKTDGNSTYALEFKRDRKVKDFAYAFWTPQYGVEAKVRFPKGTKVERWDAFGESEPLPQAADGSVKVTFSGHPSYLIASKPAEKVEVLRHFQSDIKGKTTTIARITDRSFKSKKGQMAKGTFFGSEPGDFTLRAAKDGVMGNYAEFALEFDPTKPVEHFKGGDPKDRNNYVVLTNMPEVIKEYASFALEKPVELDLEKNCDYGIWVKGNSSFAPIYVMGKTESGERIQEIRVGTVTFEGWHLLRFEAKAYSRGRRIKGAKKVFISSIMVGSARQELNPIEMAPIVSQVGIAGFAEIDRDRKVDEDDYFKSIMKTVKDKDL